MKLSSMVLQLTLLMTVASFAHAQVQNEKIRSAPIGVGDSAPDFTLEDQDGRKVTLSTARGQSPVVVVFYRGYW